MKTLIRGLKCFALAMVTMVVGMIAYAGQLEVCTDCITFTSEREFSVQMVAVGSAPEVNLEYSIDRLKWFSFTQTVSSVALAGSEYRVHLRGTNNTHFASDLSNRRCFSLTADVEVGIACSGNIETLLDYKKVAAGEHPPMDGSGFACLFLGCRSLTEVPTLPATNLTPGCYESMFSGCTSVMTAPALPATNLTENCYKGMFNGCKSLTAAPVLKAKNLTNGCYQDMFTGCSSLTAAPTLPAMNLTENCYRCMFKGCKSLREAPSLPALTLAGNCYQDMFNGCMLLMAAPQLPARTTRDGCYQSMFSGCTSLAAAPQLPAQILSIFCYQSMFSGCTSLKQPPELSATVTMPGCYLSMFSGCTSLTTLPELPSTMPTAYCYYHMFEGCSSLKVNSSSPGASWGLPSLATLEEEWNTGMFSGTGGDFTGDPEPGRTYYIASAGVTLSVSAPSTVTCQVSANGVPVSVPCTVDYTTSVSVTYTAKSGYAFPDGSSSITTNFTPNAASVMVSLPIGRHPVPMWAGITNIHVNAFVPYTESSTGKSVGNASMWLSMIEGGLAKKLYTERHKRSQELGIDYIVTNSVPDALFPTNTVIAHVWRGHGEALTNVYHELLADIAKTVIDPELVNLLTNFAPIVKSITRGAGSATIPYVDVDGNQHFGKAVVLGCEPNDWTAYDVLVKELKRIGDGYEEISYGGTVRRYIVTNSTVKILGSLTPSVSFGPLGYLSISSSEGVWKAVEQAANEYTWGRKPFYDARRARAVSCDRYLREADPTYTRDYKTEGFERFAYAYVSSRYQLVAAKMLADYGFNPELAGTNTTFHYFASLCSEKCSYENSRMRIDLQGSEAALRTIGASLRFTNLLLVNAGLLDEDFMTFDEDWKFDPEILAKAKALSTVIREEMGVNGVDYYFSESDDRTTAFADVGYVPGKKFEQLFCAGTTGKGKENPCGRSLPTNTVAGFVYQPEVTAWVELQQRFFSLLGVKAENFDKIMEAFKCHPDSFGKSAAVGLTSDRGFISTIKIENENLWISIRILLEQRGWEVHVSKTWPTVTYCVQPQLGFYIAYNPEEETITFASNEQSSMAVQRALHDRAARLVTSDNETFCKRMGCDGSLPERNVLYYIAPGADTGFLASLGDYLDTVGLGALKVLNKTAGLSNLWLCGYGVKDGNGLFTAKSNISKEFWEKYHPLFKASCKTFGQIAAAAFPYDASKARVFTFGKMTLHVSRADNWDDVNGRLYDYTGNNIRFRFQGVTSNGQTVDKTFSGRLESDGFFNIGDGTLFDRGYLTSEGVFAEYKRLTTGYYIGRLAPEIEPELSVLPSAEEIAAQVKQVVAAIGIESVTVGAAKSDGRTGPFGEETVVRETTVVPVPDGGLDRLISKKPYANKTPMTYYMPSNTAFGSMLRFADGALTNAIAAIKYVQPELMEYLEELFGSFGFTEHIGETAGDGLALGFAREESGVEPYFAVRLKCNQYQQWVDLTNRLYEAESRGEVRDVTFDSSTIPGIWEAIAFTRTDPATGRTTSRSYSRIFESEDRDPVFIITRGTKLRSGIMAHVRRAGLLGENRLVDDPTYKACAIPTVATDSSMRGFIYLAPIADAYWFYERLHATEDGHLMIERRTSAGVAPYEATTMRFIVNFFEALRGDKSVITFENDAAADKVAEAATSNVVAQLRHMRTKLGVTGLDFYDADPDEDGRYGNSELAIGTRGDGCEFLKRFAADAPSASAIVETYIPATASALSTVNGEAGYLADDVDASLKAAAELFAEKHPEVSVAITNFLASDTWRISTESMRLTGTHKAVAVLQDLDNPFVKDIGGGNYASISAGYSVLTVFGPMDSSLPFLLIKQSLAEKENWKVFTTNGIEYVIHDGQFEGRDLSQFVRPTFAFNAADNVMVMATSVAAARAAIRAGRDGTDRLVDTDTFADVTGFKQGEPMPDHNTLYYFAPQNDDILGCTLRRILSPYLPESYAMLLDRPSLKGYWGAAYGVRVKDAFRIYTHAGMKGHTAFLALGQALLKTAAESLRVRQPYDWTEPKVLRSADRIVLAEPTDVKGDYEVSNYHADSGDYFSAAIWNSGSDNLIEFNGTVMQRILSKNCAFVSTKGSAWALDGSRDALHLYLMDDEAEPADYKRGVAIQFEAYEQTFAAGEKVEQELRLWPADAKVTKTTGLPKGFSLKKTKDGYFLTGTPTKVGEDCDVLITATCIGCQTTSRDFHFMISNYASDYAELDAGYDLTAGVADALMLTNVIGWTASGVPSGMKFDKATGELSGTPAKPGEYLVVFTTKINGATEKVSTVITVGQGEGIQIDVGFSDKTSEIAADGETREIYAGVKIDWPVEVKGLEDVETTLTAKGLPNGLKLVKTTDKLTGEVFYSIQGIATKASVVDKKTGEVKPSTVVLSGTNKYKWTGEESFDLVVKALPNWAIGTFNGYNANLQRDIDGSVKVTVSKAGKVSVSLNGVSPFTQKTASDSFVFNGFDSYDFQNKCFAFSIENAKIKSGETSRLSGAIGLDLTESGLEVGCYSASFDYGTNLIVQLATNYDWGKWTFPSGKNQLTLELSNSINPGLEGLTLKFAKGGKVTVAGKVTDSETGKKVSVSASPALVPEFDADDNPKDGVPRASVGFVVKTKEPFYAYVPVWVVVGEDGAVIEVYESDPTKDGVCSWSWGTDMEGVLEQMAEHKVNQMQLSLIPWLKPSDGSSYGPSFGPAETEEMFETIVGLNARGERKVVSTMVAFPRDDWSCYEAITNTCGFMYTADPADPLGEKVWTVNSNLIEQAAVLTERLGVKHMSAVVGYLLKPVMVGGVDVNADGQLGFERLHAACELCAKHGVTLLLEFGQYSAAETKALVEAYEATYGASNLAVCFDSANSLIYGNDTPPAAFAALGDLVAQVHVSDTFESEADRIAYGGGFAADVRWGTGDVSGKYDFLTTLRDSGFDGPVLIECQTEVGDRASNIDAALKALRSADR